MVVFNATVTVLFAYFILNLLNRFIAPVRLKATESAIGGLVSLAISLLGTVLFVLFVKFFGEFNAFYGSLSIILVFLFWVYILMVGIISGVLVTAKLYYSRKNGGKTGV
jgi:membrane protein